MKRTTTMSSRSSKSSAILFCMCTFLLACGPGDDDDTTIPCDANLLAGDLVITEVFADADGSDEGKEWFEIFNSTSNTIELEGVVLIASKANGDDEVTHVMATHIIEAGAYAVVGGVADEFRPPYVDYGYGDGLRVGASRGLPNADGKLALHCGAIAVDEMTWSVMASGASKTLDGVRSPDYQENDDLQFWCDSVTEFQAGALGTPGATNDACSSVAPTMCDDGGTTRELVSPVLGDLVITEVFAAPDTAGNGGPGSDGEWFEVKVLKDVDINGLQLGQAETTGPKDVDTTVTSVPCLRVSAGSYLVFAASDDSNLNGGLPAVDYVIDFGLTNSDDGVFIGFGGTPLDIVTWASSSTGKSRSLDKDSVDATGNDEDRFWCTGIGTYGTQSQEGTPSVENGNCVIAPPDGMCFLPGGGMRAIDKAAAGEIIVNEWMVSPTGTDSNREFVEFKALADFDLNGLEFGPATPAGGAGSVRQTYPGNECAPVTSGELILAVQSLVEADNGGIPPADIDFELMVSLPAGPTNGGGIFVGIDGTPLDTVTWTSGDIVGGQSVQVDPSNTALTCAPSGTYGNGDDSGTPNVENLCL